MSKPIIAVDVDDVLLESGTAIIADYNQRFGTQLPLSAFYSAHDVAAWAAPDEAFDLRVGVADLRSFVIQGRLAEAFLEDAGGVQQLVGDDGIEHAHATLVEDAHDGFFVLQLLGQRVGQLLFLAAHFHALQRGDVFLVVLEMAVLQPFFQGVAEVVVECFTGGSGTGTGTYTDDDFLQFSADDSTYTQVGNPGTGGGTPVPVTVAFSASPTLRARVSNVAMARKTTMPAAIPAMTQRRRRIGATVADACAVRSR